MLKRLVFLLSGRGSNLQALVQACREQAWPAQIAAVISNRPDSEGLAWARSQGLNTQVVDHTRFESRQAFDEALREVIDVHEPHGVVLCGFMRVLGDAFVEHFSGRLINIHPSLLPAFPGLKTHRQALEAGVKLAGATVHFVTPTLDHGPIIAQATVPVLPQDTEYTLAERVLQAEHRLYPLALGWFVRDELQITGGLVSHRLGASQLLLP